MSKRRKNAGEGYGYIFSGAFAKKSDAVKKEKKRKGSFVKAVMMRSGMRYAVMTPRTNPIKRKKKPAVTPPTVQQNPAELVVMGANPHENREINLPAGSSITIRVNPAQCNPLCGATIGGELCTRNAGHRGPHLPQGATMRTRSRLRKGWKPRSANPSAAAIRESFTGAEADKVSIRNAPHMPPGDYAQLGELLALYVKPLTGGQVQQITFSKPYPLIVSDETARQIYFVGGDQDVGSASFSTHQRGGLVELGEARRIDYKQRKEHVPDPSNDEWRHDFGEETGVRPLLLFDRHHKQLLLEGGEYVIRAEGIVN
jgi:hypothetical protein